MIPSHLLQEFHTDESQGYTSPELSIGLPVLALLIGLVVPCCGYFGARNNNRHAVCLFAGCNCLLGFVQVILVIACILGTVALGVVVEHCKPAEAQLETELRQTCDGIMEGCKYMKSDNFDLTKYEGCYDYMSSEMSNVMALLGLCTAFSCCVGCLACASCWWGRELHSTMDYQDICDESSGDDERAAFHRHDEG